MTMTEIRAKAAALLALVQSQTYSEVYQEGLAKWIEQVTMSLDSFVQPD